MSVVRNVLVCLAVLGFCLPAPIFAAPVAAVPQPVVVDVGLMDGGILLGQVVDRRGAGLAEVAVSVRSQAKQVATATTDAGGRFAIGGLPAGVYQIAAANVQATYRLWASGVAPPSASRTAMIVAGNDTVRGQCGTGRLRACLANPWVIAGIVATSVAVPVALANARKPGTP